MLRSISYHLLALAREQRTLLGYELAALEVSPGQELVLAQLWREDGLPHTELARRLGVSAPATTKTVRRMERAALVRREGDADDARVVRVFVTERGEQVRREVERRWSVVERRLLASLSADEARTLLVLLATAADPSHRLARRRCRP